MVDVYSESQTEFFSYKINEDGTLPRNEFNNWEVNLLFCLFFGMFIY